MTKNEKGFSIIEILLIVVVVGLIAAVGWLVYDRQASNTKTTDPTTTSETSKQDSTKQSEAPELVAGDFGEKGDYGTFQAEGYAKVLKEVADTDADCGMSNPGVECPKIDGVFFTVTKTPNEKALAYINARRATADNTLLVGCPVNDTIAYTNFTDTYYSYTISKDDTNTILASSKDNPVRLEITKGQVAAGKDAPSCYSNFTTYKIID